jgi:hypothetical protein
MAKGGKVVELKEEDYVWNAVGKKLIVSKVDDKNYYFDGFDSSKSAFPKELVNNYIKKGAWTLKNPKMAYGGETQGYDDREDERLGMKYGKMASKDLNSTRARRDDARFEERGKMADGGMIELQSVGAIYNPQTNMIYAMYSKDEGYKHKGKEYDVESGQDVDEIDDEYFLNALSQEDKAILFGNKMADGGSLSSMKEEYYENEDNNAHSENVVLLAKHFGTKEDLTEAKRILALHEKEGSLSSENGKKRQVLHLKLIEKARTEMAKDGIEFEKGGKLIGKQKNLDVNENGKLDAEDFKMLRKQRMAHGGVTEQEVVDSNAQMVLSKIKEVHHHADELGDVVTKNSDIEAWVVAKIERASTDLSDITHYLDGQHEKMSMGGSVYHHAHKMDKK